MVTKNVVIGTTIQLVVGCAPDQVIDILIQNLSANNVYVGDDDVSSSNGMKIIATTGSYSNDKRKSPVFLVADGASSDVRLCFEIYKEGTR